MTVRSRTPHGNAPLFDACANTNLPVGELPSSTMTRCAQTQASSFKRSDGGREGMVCLQLLQISKFFFDKIDMHKKSGILHTTRSRIAFTLKHPNKACCTVFPKTQVQPLALLMHCASWGTPQASLCCM
eukprot:552192-Amphidinium_carterae.2